MFNYTINEGNINNKVNYLIKYNYYKISKNFAILYASRIDGLYRPFSRELIVCRETPISLASSSCRIPLILRISSILFFISSPTSIRCKVSFTSEVYFQRPLFVKQALHFWFPPVHQLNTMRKAPRKKDQPKSWSFLHVVSAFFHLPLTVYFSLPSFSSGFSGIPSAPEQSGGFPQTSELLYCESAHQAAVPQ